MSTIWTLIRKTAGAVLGAGPHVAGDPKIRPTGRPEGRDGECSVSCEVWRSFAHIGDGVPVLKRR